MDKYSIKRKIDGGNQGAIYLGSRKDDSSEKMLAVKQIACNSTEELERVQKEVRLVTATILLILLDQLSVELGPPTRRQTLRVTNRRKRSNSRG
jgi:hypothetical protein